MKKYFMKDNYNKDIFKLIQEKKRCNEELKQLENDTHPGYLLSIKKIDERLKNEIIKLKNMCQFKIDEINQEYDAELKLLEKEANDYYQDYIDHAINELDSKRRLLENEKNIIDINSSSGGDILEIKPMNTRKLRRRGQDSTCPNESNVVNSNVTHESLNTSANITFNPVAISIGSGFIANFNPDVSQMFGVGQGFGASSLANNNNPVSEYQQIDVLNPQSSTKRRRTNGSVVSIQLNTILPESSISNDLLKIQRSCSKTNVNDISVNESSLVDSTTARRHSSSALHAVNINDKQLFKNDRTEATLPHIWVDDGRLFLGNKCITQNMQVTVESRDNNIHKCVCVVMCISVQDITLKRLSDNGIFKVSLLHIRSGKTVLSYCNNAAIVTNSKRQ